MSSVTLVPAEVREKLRKTIFLSEDYRTATAQTLTGRRASIAMLDVRLLCDAEFVVWIDSVAAISFCSLLRASSQTFSTPLPFCWFACVLRFGNKSDYHEVKCFGFNFSHLPPPKLFVPLCPSSITLFSCLLVSVELGAVWWCCFRLAVRLFPMGLWIVK